MSIREKACGALGACSFMAACASQFTPKLDVEEHPSKAHSFVYGRFEVNATPQELGDDSYDTMGLTLQCNDGKLYRLRFEAAQPLLVIAVEPSTCWITEVVFAESDGHILGRRLFERGMLDNMRFEAGHAYYLGDFFGNVQQRLTADERGLGHETRWNLNGVRNHYQNTTEDLFIAYPKLSRVRTVNQLGLSAKERFPSR
jgi:hypothetical protein